MNDRERKWFEDQVDEAERLLVRLRGSIRVEKITHNLAEAEMVTDDTIDVLNRIMGELDAMRRANKA